MQKLIILVGFIILIFGYFFPYFIGISTFPSGADFAAYYLEYTKYSTSGKLYELINIWYEPGYFMYLNTLERITNNFQLGFLISEITMVVLYFGSFYLFLGSYTKLSYRKKIIVCFLFVFSLSQFVPFIFSLRKQYFCGFFLIFYLAILGRKAVGGIKILLLGLFMSMIFFTHRGIAFYGGIFLIPLFFHPKQNKILILSIFKSILIGLLVNISYILPFFLIQISLLKDTFTLFTNNIQVATGLISTGGYKARGFDMYQGKTDNTWVSYFFANTIIFLYLFSLIRFIRRDKIFIYFVILNLFIFSGSVMAGRLGHVANFFAIYFFGHYIWRQRKMLIIFFSVCLVSFVSTAFQRNMNNRYFSVIDEYLQNFYGHVPKENTFMISLSNTFLRFSGYNNEYSFSRPILMDTYPVFIEKSKLTNTLVDFRSLFFLYGYRTVILPESLKGYDIYVVFGYFTENYLSPEARKYFISNRISSKNFLNSPLYELVNLNGGKSPLNNYKGYYPINSVFRLKEGAEIKYVPDNEIIAEALSAIYSSY